MPVRLVWTSEGRRVTVIAALRKWIAQVEADAHDGEIPPQLAASYVVVKEALAEHDTTWVLSEQDVRLLRSLRIAA